MGHLLRHLRRDGRDEIVRMIGIDGLEAQRGKSRAHIERSQGPRRLLIPYDHGRERRNPDSVLSKPHDRGQGIRVVDRGILDPCIRELPDHPVMGRAVLGVGEDGLIGKLGQRQRPVGKTELGACEPRAGEDAQVEIDEIGSDHRPHDQGQVDLSVGDFAREVEAGVGIEIDRHAGITLPNPLDELRQPCMDDRVDRPDSDRTPQASGIAHRLAEFIGDANQFFGFADRLLSKHGQPHAARIPLEEPDPEIPLQGGYPVGDRRLR
jgi:hypothetical protein